jgi:hypothetical protein
MWDTETVRQTSPVDECQITDIHSVAHHQRLVQAVEHWASELTSSVALLFVTAVQIQWWPMILYIDCHEFFWGGDYSSLLMTSVPEIYLNKHSYKV